MPSITDPVPHVCWVPMAAAVPMMLGMSCAMATEYLTAEQAQHLMFAEATTWRSGQSGTGAGYEIFPHNEGRNLALVDGHCKWYKQQQDLQGVLIWY